MRQAELNSRGQAASDYLLVVAIILAVIVAVVLPLLSQAEISVALAAARSGAGSFAAKNSFTLASMDYVVSGNVVTFTPALYSAGARVAGSRQLQFAVLSSVSAVFTPGVAVAGDCVQGLYNRYCVGGG